MKYWTILDAELNPVKVRHYDEGVKLIIANCKSIKYYDKLEDAYAKLIDVGEVIPYLKDEQIGVKLPLQVGLVEIDMKFYSQEQLNNIKGLL